MRGEKFMWWWIWKKQRLWDEAESDITLSPSRAMYESNMLKGRRNAGASLSEWKNPLDAAKENPYPIGKLELR